VTKGKFDISQHYTVTKTIKINIKEIHSQTISSQKQLASLTIVNKICVCNQLYV